MLEEESMDRPEMREMSQGRLLRELLSKFRVEMSAVGLRQVERSTRNGNLPFQRYLRPIRMWSNMPGEGIGWRSQRYGSPWSESPGDKVQTRGKEQNHRTIANFYYLNTNRRKGLKKDQKKKEKGTAVS